MSIPSQNTTKITVKRKIKRSKPSSTKKTHEKITTDERYQPHFAEGRAAEKTVTDLVDQRKQKTLYLQLLGGIRKQGSFNCRTLEEWRNRDYRHSAVSSQGEVEKNKEV